MIFILVKLFFKITIKKNENKKKKICFLKTIKIILKNKKQFLFFLAFYFGE